MRSRATALGHPIHPMLIPFPIAFLTGAVIFDAAGWLRGSPAWWTTGGHLAAAGIVTGLLAAVPGLVDYFGTVPPNSSAKARATKHLVINVSAIALFAIGWLIRGGAAAPPDLTVLALDVSGLALLSVGGYLGGTLVTRNMIGVDHRYARAGKWRETSVRAPAGGSGVEVAEADELEVDQMKLLHVEGRRIVLARLSSGYAAFDDRCTHKGASLAGGVLVCGVVQCLWHGSQFDAATGRVKAGPAKKDISTHDVFVRAGKVILTLDGARAKPHRAKRAG